MASPAANTASAREEDTAKGRPTEDGYFGEILERCCGMGRWQMLLAAYASVTFLLFPALSLSMVFVGATPDFRCADGFDESTTFVDLPASTPRCHAANSTAACTRWAFDRSVYTSTVVTEWLLVCDRKPLLSMLQSWLMIGGIACSVVTGQLADRFGRRPVFLPCMVLLVAAMFASAFAPSYALFAATRFLMGAGIVGMVSSQYVVMMEAVSPRWRAFVGVVSIISFPVGTSLLAVASYAIPDGQMLRLAYACPFLLLLLNFWLMPESPRWLVHHGRFDEACAVLRSAARWNGRTMPPEQEVRQLMATAHCDVLARRAELKGASGLQQLLQLFRTPQMRRCTLVYIVVCFITSGAFYGISFDMTQLSSSPHLAGVLSGVTSIPSYFVTPLLDRLGRRPSMVLFFVGSAACMLLVLVSADETLGLVLGLAAKFGVGAAFGSLGPYITECFPTQARGQAFGVVQTAFRMGAALSPFVVDLVSELHPTAPSAVFGALLLVAAGACLLLPETLGLPMPESVAEVEEAAVRRRRDAKLPSGIFRIFRQRQEV